MEKLERCLFVFVFATDICGWTDVNILICHLAAPTCGPVHTHVEPWSQVLHVVLCVWVDFVSPIWQLHQSVCWPTCCNNNETLCIVRRTTVDWRWSIHHRLELCRLLHTLWYLYYRSAYIIRLYTLQSLTPLFGWQVGQYSSSTENPLGKPGLTWSDLGKWTRRRRNGSTSSGYVCLSITIAAFHLLYYLPGLQQLHWLPVEHRITF